MVRHGRCWFQMGWRLFGFGLLEEMKSGRLLIVDLGETRAARAAETVMLDLRRRSDEMLMTLHGEQCAGIRSQPSAPENG